MVVCLLATVPESGEWHGQQLLQTDPGALPAWEGIEDMLDGCGRDAAVTVHAERPTEAAPDDALLSKQLEVVSGGKMA